MIAANRSRSALRLGPGSTLASPPPATREDDESHGLVLGYTTAESAVAVERRAAAPARARARAFGRHRRLTHGIQRQRPILHRAPKFHPRPTSARDDPRPCPDHKPLTATPPSSGNCGRRIPVHLRTNTDNGPLALWRAPLLSPKSPLKSKNRLYSIPTPRGAGFAGEYRVYLQT